MDSLPATVTTVTLNQHKPVILPETISRCPHIPVNVLHKSNYALLENVKLCSSLSSPMWYKVLCKYHYFVFRYINTSHLELFTHKDIAVEEKLDILSRLKIERLVLLFHIEWSITPKLLLRFKNTVCISSNIFPRETLFPFELIKEIQSLEIIYLAINVSFPVEEFDKMFYTHHLNLLKRKITLKQIV